MEHTKTSDLTKSELNQDSFLEQDLTFSSVPTYYWAEIQTPHLKSIPSLILNEQVTVTQKVHLQSQGSKNTPPHPACVIYDSYFLEYKMLELLGSLICDWKEEQTYSINDLSDNPQIESEKDLQIFLKRLLGLLTNGVTNGLNIHQQAINYCNEMGITLPFDSKSFLRSFKLAANKCYHNSLEF